MASLPPLLLLLSLSLLLHSSTAIPHRIPLLSHSPQLSAASNTTLPTTYFEVSKPVNHPNTNPCSHHILHHDFASSYGKPPVLANYTPPTNCPSSDFSSIILEWKATSKGRQFDRIFGVWLGGVELLRSCTAEPRPNGIVWTVRKDITKYSSLLMSNQTLSVYVGNIVDTTYTGVYDVDITVHFYPSSGGVEGSEGGGDHSDYGYGNRADLILPISRNSSLNDGLWFEVVNSTDVQTKEFVVPSNVYRAVLEVYVSPHENDEFWYSNLPDEYIEANNLTNSQRNGPFREVVVTLDGGVIGAVWPFTVVYTGGINPLLWRPISGIGSFDLPTYDIEVTPFIGSLLDGKAHEIGFSVTNALNVWYVDANLHLWLDNKSSKTEGKLLSSEAPPLAFSSSFDSRGLNGKLTTYAKRSVSSTGYVQSSYGKITTSFNQQISYSNIMDMGNAGNLQIVNQTIRHNTETSSAKPFSAPHKVLLNRRFPLYLSMNQLNEADDGYVVVANITLGFEENRLSGSGSSKYSGSSLRNYQNAQGNMVVEGNLVQSGLGSTQQVYEFESNLEPCYYRSVGCSNVTILYDNSRSGCSKTAMLKAGSTSWSRALD